MASRMTGPLVGLLAGLLFGAGLVLSGMADRGKVLSFLDVAGVWDPSLALVLFTGIAVHVVGRRLLRGRDAAVSGAPLPVLPRSGIDGRLILGAAVFGLGWGIVGFCPGPAVVAGAAGVREAYLFLPAMIAGVLVHRTLTRTGGTASRSSGAEEPEA